MTRFKMFHASAKISGKYDHRRGVVVQNPDSRVQSNTYVRMYTIPGKWWHRILPKKTRLVIPATFDPKNPWFDDYSTLEFIADRVKYGAYMTSWLTYDSYTSEFTKLYEVKLHSKRDATLIKLAWA